MLGYNIPKLLIIEARKELKKDIDSKHPSVRKLQKQANKISWHHAKIVFFAVLAYMIAFEVPHDFQAFRTLGLSDALFVASFDILFFPALFSIFAKCISLFVFYYKNGIPIKQIPVSSSTNFSSRSSYGSSISVNPASGLPMCGSVDVSGNAPGHSQHY